MTKLEDDALRGALVRCFTVDSEGLEKASVNRPTLDNLVRLVHQQQQKAVISELERLSMSSIFYRSIRVVKNGDILKRIEQLNLGEMNND